jgi:hypothetical protein
VESDSHTAASGAGGGTAQPGLRLAASSAAPAGRLPSDAACLGSPLSGGWSDPTAVDRSQAILEATKHVAGLLKASGQRFALAGGVAAYAHGVARRSLHDTDFCVLREDADKVVEVLTTAGLRVWAPPEDWLIKAECQSQAIDLIFELADQSVTPELLDRAQVLPVDSMRMPVLAPTDLICSLLSAFSEHHCDFGAVLPIARTVRERIEWAEVRRRVGANAMADAFLYLLERLDVIGPAAPADRTDRTDRAGPTSNTSNTSNLSNTSSSDPTSTDRIITEEVPR